MYCCFCSSCCCIFFPRIVLCAILLYLSIVVVVVQFGFFIRIFILSTSLEFQFTLCCCFAVSCLHSAALSCRALPLSPLSLTLLSLSLSLHTDTICSRTRTRTFAAVYRMRESAVKLPLTQCDDRRSLSLSRSLVFILSAFPHILYYFATCGKSTSRLVAHFAFDASVAISALFFAHHPPPHICICLHLCVCVCIFCFCFAWACCACRLSFAARAIPGFIFCQLQQRLRAAIRQTS